jgi:ribonuclease VapC
MIVDSSAIIAILKDEPGAEALRDIAVGAHRCGMSAATLVETGMVVEGQRGEAGAAELDLLLGELRIEVIPFDAEQAALARDAFRRFGKGRHPAGLNFGDCLAYALAKHLGEPLLFTGDDFTKTDLATALPG